MIIITGLPCTGKTTLARGLSERFSLPLFTKDELKELLFDSLGWQDRAWSKKISAACYELLFNLAETQLKAGCSFILEGNFYPAEHAVRFLALRDRWPCHSLEVQCVGEGEVLCQRFVARSGTRHPGHVDESAYETLRPILLAGRTAALDLGGEYLEIDTTVRSEPTAGDGIDDHLIDTTVRSALKRAASG